MPYPPLTHLGEKVLHDGAEWVLEDTEGRCWVIRWFSGSQNLAAMAFGHRVRAIRRRGIGDINAARREAAGIHALLNEEN